MSDEFALIKRLLLQIPEVDIGAVDIGPGDDAAVVSVPTGQQLVVTTDTLNADIHFFSDTDPEAIGYKSLAVNLSDLAAMGAVPRWVSLSISLPDRGIDPEVWLDRFAGGFAELSSQYRVMLIGGDLTSGPLSITVTALGLVPVGTAIKRNGAMPGDAIMVSGKLGDASAALQLLMAQQPVPSDILMRLLRPQPRVELGQALRGVANSMIDISDGLLADLEHMLIASGCGGRLDISALPVSNTLRSRSDFDYQWPLSGGDDYELCFTVAQQNLDELNEINSSTAVQLTKIGEVTAGEGITCTDPLGNVQLPASKGWNHFQ